MLPRKIPFSFFSSSIVPAIVAVTALIAVAPSVATARTAAPAQGMSAAQQTSNKASTATDISASRRRHYAHRRGAVAMRAFGSFVGGGPVYAVPSYGGYSRGYPGYGYGFGDNNRNRTSG
jgi:hypothetical protein